MIGTVFTNRNGTKAEVIEYVNFKNVVVKFKDEYEYIGVFRLCHLKENNFRNPYDKIFYGVGCYGEGTSKLSGKSRKLNGVWRHMLERCYDESCEAFPWYGGKGIYVDPHWHNFQNFLVWAEEECKLPNWHLDKDILSGNDKFYGPDTCCFVPPQVNMAFTNLTVVNGKPLGVFKTKYGSFVARLGTGGGSGSKYKHLGVFENQDLAAQAYKSAKEDYIKSLAFKWKDTLDDKVFDALLSWKLELSLDND